MELAKEAKTELVKVKAEPQLKAKISKTAGNKKQTCLQVAKL